MGSDARWRRAFRGRPAARSPRALEAGGEQVAGGGEHVQVEEREAIGCGRAELAGETAVARI